MAMDFVTEQACRCRSCVLTFEASKTRKGMPSLSPQSSSECCVHSRGTTIRSLTHCLVSGSRREGICSWLCSVVHCLELFIPSTLCYRVVCKPVSLYYGVKPMLFCFPYVLLCFAPWTGSELYARLMSGRDVECA